MLPVQTGTAKFELEIELAPTPDGGLTGWIEYARELFDASTVTRLAQGLRLLLADGVDRPDTLGLGPERPGRRRPRPS